MRLAVTIAAVTLITSLPALSRPNYEACVETAAPAECIARRAIEDGWPERDDVADAIVRHGLVDEVTRHSRQLARVAREQVGNGAASLKELGFILPEGPATRAARSIQPKVFLAAAALLTAARHQKDPFADPTVQALMVNASNDPMIPFLALDFWHEFIHGGNSFDKSVKFAGLEAIWRQVVANRELAPDFAHDIASWLAFYEELGEAPKVYWVWYGSRSGLTSSEKSSTASLLVRYYSAADEAERLMASGGETAPDMDNSAILTSIAAARLESGYDEKAARHVVSYMLDEAMKSGDSSNYDEDRNRDALEKGGAVHELREAADQYLKHAQAARPGVGAANWYAAASDCYRRAGDLERAREVARSGLPFVADAVRQRLGDREVMPGTSPRWLAAMVRGWGTAPVIALYRAGAIEEALKFGYLSGRDRFDNAEIAGEPRDPQWVLGDNTRIDTWALVTSTIGRGDPAWARQVFEALKKTCKSAYSDCYDETLVDLAGLAAMLGDEAEMKQILAARARQIDKSRSGSFWAVRFAAECAHALELLATSHISASH